MIYKPLEVKILNKRNDFKAKSLLGRIERFSHRKMGKNDNKVGSKMDRFFISFPISKRCYCLR